VPFEVPHTLATPLPLLDSATLLRLAQARAAATTTTAATTTAPAAASGAAGSRARTAGNGGGISGGVAIVQLGHLHPEERALAVAEGGLAAGRIAMALGVLGAPPLPVMLEALAPQVGGAGGSHDRMRNTFHYFGRFELLFMRHGRRA